MAGRYEEGMAMRRAVLPAAELVVARTEVEFWATPMARSGQFAAHVEDAEIEVVEAARAEGRVREVGGEAEVLPGVSAIEVGGHSPGQLMFLVAGERRDVLLTSDAVHLYEDFERDRPSSVVADLVAMYRAHARIRDFAAAGATVVPGHDPLVMDRFPALDGVDFAVGVQPATPDCTQSLPETLDHRLRRPAAKRTTSPTKRAVSWNIIPWPALR